MLSKTTLYIFKALSALGHLDRSTYLGANAIGKELDMPVNYLGKTLQSLVKKGFVISQKGFGGGFRLARPPEQINLLEVIEAFEETEFLSNCFWGRPTCSEEEPCPMHEKWKSIVELTRNIFQNTTVADIMQKAVI
ncbi:RrF2 family transcriptional regulator [candidate division KSB1 bacterium]